MVPELSIWRSLGVLPFGRFPADLRASIRRSSAAEGEAISHAACHSDAGLRRVSRQREVNPVSSQATAPAIAVVRWVALRVNYVPMRAELRG